MFFAGRVCSQTLPSAILPHLSSLDPARTVQTRLTRLSFHTSTNMSTHIPTQHIYTCPYTGNSAGPCARRMDKVRAAVRGGRTTRHRSARVLLHVNTHVCTHVCTPVCTYVYRHVCTHRCCFSSLWRELLKAAPTPLDRIYSLCRLCVDMCIEMCMGMCIDMHAGMRAGMHVKSWIFRSESVIDRVCWHLYV